MNKRNAIILTVTIAALLMLTSCNEEEEQMRTPGSTSVGGAVILTGVEIDDEWEIVEPQVYFSANEEFYFHFHNNMPFDTEQVAIQLIDNRNDEILAENNYEVNPEESLLVDMIWFGKEGMYTLKAIVDGEVRATREVLIE